MKITNKNHATFRASWKRYAEREVVVTVTGPGEVAADYIDFGGERRGCGHLLTVARVEVLAMHWADWTLVWPDGTTEQRKGWLHADFDGESSVARDAEELARREQARDEHPRSRELAWSVYETSLDYAARFGDSPMREPSCTRPTAAEIAAAPL